MCSGRAEQIGARALFFVSFRGKMPNASIIEKGARFSRLTVVKELPRRVFPSGQTQRLFLCECSCDKKTRIPVQLANLRSGNTTSCGCYNSEASSARHKIHGKVSENRLLYNVYQAMLARCYDENNVSYKNYGARGITVCNRWKNKKTGIHAFFDWALANGYDKGLELDRKNTNKRYEPDNCRFITHVQNNRNKRDNVVIDGVVAIEYFEKHDRGLIDKRTFYRRIRKGWSFKDAINEPSRKGCPLNKRNPNASH